jgi:hypothetical protein
MTSENGEMREELQDEQQIFDLPSRHALSIVDPAIFGAGLPPLLGRGTMSPQPTPPTADGAQPTPPLA